MRETGFACPYGDLRAFAPRSVFEARVAEDDLREDRGWDAGEYKKLEKKYPQVDWGGGVFLPYPEDVYEEAVEAGLSRERVAELKEDFDSFLKREGTALTERILRDHPELTREVEVGGEAYIMELWDESLRGYNHDY